VLSHDLLLHEPPCVVTDVLSPRSQNAKRRENHWRIVERFTGEGAMVSRLSSHHVRHVRRQLQRLWLPVAIALFIAPSTALAQSPWERAASNLETSFTGPLARSLALVSIVIGGLMFMFGEGGAKRQISGIVFGGGLALFAAQFLTWLF